MRNVRAFDIQEWVGGCVMRGSGQRVTTQPEASMAAEAREWGVEGKGSARQASLVSLPLTSPPEAREGKGRQG